MTPLLCARCGREILPGTPVWYVAADDDRIFTDDDMLVTHKECP